MGPSLETERERLEKELEHQRRLVRMYRGIAHQLEERHDLRARTLRMPWGEAFVRFVHELEERLHRGHAEYGEKSWKRPDTELADEVDQELLDIVGWTFIRWGKRHMHAETQH